VTNEHIVNTNELSGLELAKYVLGRLTNGQNTIEKIAEDFDNNKIFILEIVDFFKDIGWIKQDQNGSYKITKKDQTNTIIRERPTIDFRVPT
jgi:phage regulator Rha-like protein